MRPKIKKTTLTVKSSYIANMIRTLFKAILPDKKDIELSDVFCSSTSERQLSSDRF